jgi:hypothetical protein
VRDPTIAEEKPAPAIEGSTDESVRVAREEFDRERRLVDQMLSMQARLRDWYRGGATFMTCTILGASTVGIAFAFAGNDGSVDVLGVRADRTTWLGWLAVATFVVTLIDLVLNLRGAARQRQDAVDQLGDLKAGYYAPIDSTEEPLALQRLSERYRATMGAIPGIPERHFNRLKAKHLRKVEISRILSEQPGISARQAAAKLRKRNSP